MTRKLQIIALSALLLGAPLSLRAEMGYDEVDTELTAATLSVNGTRIRVTNADGQTLEVYNLTGVKVASFRIDSNEKTVNLNNQPKGCYIVKVGKVVRKISIR